MKEQITPSKLLSICIVIVKKGKRKCKWKEPSYWEEWDFIRKGKVIVQFSTCMQKSAINKEEKIS